MDLDTIQYREHDNAKKTAYHLRKAESIRSLTVQVKPLLLMGDDAWNMIHVRQHNVALLLYPLCLLPRVPYSDQSNLVSHRNTLLEIETV